MERPPRLMPLLCSLLIAFSIVPLRSVLANGVVALLPWEHGNDSGAFPWEGLHNNLPELLRVQARDNTIFAMIFNDGFAGLALNNIASLVRYGQASNYIVGVLGVESLRNCIRLRLPCYDATLLGQNGTDSQRDAKRNTVEWFHLVWAKTLVANQIFKQGYDVVFADADLAFIKPALRNYNRFLDAYDADGTFMHEEKNVTGPDGNISLNKYLNSGNFMLRNNERTQFMMEDWMRGFTEQSEQNGNQLWLNWMHEMAIPSYQICHTREQCRALKRRSYAAIKPHPNQYDGMGAYCTPSHIPDLCSDRRLYIHAICRQGHLAKKKALEHLGLWFIDVESWPDSVRVLDPDPAVLPCQSDQAWHLPYK